jgi:hypothetical protein
VGWTGADGAIATGGGFGAETTVWTGATATLETTGESARWGMIKRWPTRIENGGSIPFARTSSRSGTP